MKLPKFYRYLIYKLYTWALEKNDSNPVATIIFSMTFIHTIQILLLLLIIGNFIPGFSLLFLKDAKVYMVFYFALFSSLYYFIVYNKKRWNEYLEEFKNETPRERSRGKRNVLFFTLGSIVLFFMYAYAYIFI